MAFAIPKIEYKNVDTTGDTSNGNGVISNIPDTSEIEVGMFVRATGVPSTATVGSKTSTSVTLAGGALATATATGVDLAFGYKIEFEYPPVEPNGEIKTAKATVTVSVSGVKQTSLQNIECNRSLKFSFLSETIYQLLKTFLDEHAMLGRDFRYYENKTLTSYVTYDLDDLKYTPKKIAPKGEDLYVWEVPLKFYRVL